MFPLELSWISRILVAGVCLAFQAGISNTGAVPPLNDTCAGAVVIPGGGPFPYLAPLIPDVTLAVAPEDPEDLLLSDCVTDTEDGTNGVWYVFTPDLSGVYSFSTGPDTGTTIDDTVMGIFTSSSGDCGGDFTEVDCNDDEADLRAGLSLELDAGETYYIVSWIGLLGTTAGQAALELKVTKPRRPRNDTCDGAEIIPGAGPFPHLTGVTDITLGTSEDDPSLPDCGLDAYRGMWYEFAPAETGLYEISTCSPTGTTLFDTLIAVYTSSSPCGGVLTELGCDDGSCGNLARLQSTFNAGTTYYIVVFDAFDVDPVVGETLLQLEIRRFKPPTVTTLPAFDVTSTGGTFSGLVNPNGLPTVVAFEWGFTPALGTTLVLPSVLPGVDAVIAQSAVTGGFPTGSEIHYRIRAQNNLGSSEGAPQIFQWSGVSPVITSIGRETNGAYRIRFDGSPGQAYRVEVSNDRFQFWNLLGPALDEGAGSFRFDHLPGVLPVRYYRVYSP